MIYLDISGGHNEIWDDDEKQHIKDDLIKQ